MEPVCSLTPLGSPCVWVVGSLPPLLLTPPSQADTTKGLGWAVGETLAGASAGALPALTHLRAPFGALRLPRCPAWKSLVPLLDLGGLGANGCQARTLVASAWEGGILLAHNTYYICLIEATWSITETAFLSQKMLLFQTTSFWGT